MGVRARIKKCASRLHSDAGARGLYLKTTMGGTGSWIFRWRDRGTGRLRDMGIGSYPDVGLEDARDHAFTLRKKVNAGQDPIAERRIERQRRITEHAKAQTFQQVSDAYFQARIEGTGLTEKHKRRWKSMMRDHAYPKIGGVLVEELETAHIESVLKPIWYTKLDTAKRVRQNIENVLNFAKGGNLLTGENPARWRGGLDSRLPKPREIRKARPVQHFRALPWNEISTFVARLRKREGLAARALELLILTAVRSAEVRFATWDEFDLKSKLWTIPGTRTKSGRRHAVPLSHPAVKLLNSGPRRADSNFVFSAPRGGPLSDMSLSAVLRRMDVDGTVHGFRSTFKDWARNSTAYADEVSELALAHVNDNATRAAYARDELMPKRDAMMRDWAKFVDAPPARGSVTPINQSTG